VRDQLSTQRSMALLSAWQLLLPEYWPCGGYRRSRAFSFVCFPFNTNRIIICA